MRSSKNPAQGYTDFYKRNAYTKPSGETRSVGAPEGKSPFEVSIKFGSGLSPYKMSNDDDDDERKAAIRRRLRKLRKK